MKALSYIVAGLLSGAAFGFFAGAVFLAGAARIRNESFDGMGVIFFGLCGSAIGAGAGFIVGVAFACSRDSEKK
jgi:hypothetical protein